MCTHTHTPFVCRWKVNKLNRGEDIAKCAIFEIKYIMCVCYDVFNSIWIIKCISVERIFRKIYFSILFYFKLIKDQCREKHNLCHDECGVLKSAEWSYVTLVCFRELSILLMTNRFDAIDKFWHFYIKWLAQQNNYHFIHIYIMASPKYMQSIKIHIIFV